MTGRLFGVLYLKCCPGRTLGSRIVVSKDKWITIYTDADCMMKKASVDRNREKRLINALFNYRKSHIPISTNEHTTNRFT